MATTRIKDLSKTATTVNSDANLVLDGNTGGTQKITRDNFRQDTADAFVAAPGTYNLAPINSGTGKIDATYLPTSSDTPKGAWNASTNTPTLADGSGTAGDYYDVTVAGSSDLGSGSITFTVGDVVKYDGTTWFKIDSVTNILDGVSTIDGAKAAIEIPDVGSSANEVSLNGQLGTMAFQDSAGVSVGQLEVTDKVNGPLGIDGSPGSYAYSGADDLVVGDASGSRGITISTGSSDTGALYFGDAATTGLESYRGMVRYSHSSDKLELGTLSQVRATIDSSGNVGIGQSSPVGKLEVAVTPTTSATTVNETADFADSAIISNGGTSANGDRIPLVFNVGNSGANGISAAIVGERESSGWNTALSFWTNGVTSGAEGTDAIQEAMRIDSQGRLGVNQTSPSTNANSIADDLVVGNTGQASGITVVGGTGSTSAMAFGSGGTTIKGGMVYDHPSNSLQFSANSATRWLLNSSGNLQPNGAYGIDFGSGASTTLDAYEEGLWSATLTPATSGTITVDGSVNALRYTIVGRVAHIQGKLNVTAVSSPVGNFVKVSLPTAVGVPDINEESGSTAGSVVVIGAAGAMNDYTLLAIEGSDHLRIYKGTGTAPSSTAADFSGDEQVYINATYIIS